MSEIEQEVLEGGCHCGAVRFRVTVRSREAMKMQLQRVLKKGYLHLIVPESDFDLLRGGNALTTYTFGTGTAKHHFCRNCGVHSYYRPRSHPEQVDVNVRCLDGVEPSEKRISPGKKTAKPRKKERIKCGRIYKKFDTPR